MANALSGTTKIGGTLGQTRVTLVNTATNAVVSTTLSDASTGAWSFTGLAAGMYDGMCLKDGYKPLVHGPFYISGFASFSAEVLSDNPTWYGRHNETSGTTVINSAPGGTNGTYGGGAVTFGAPAIYPGGAPCWDLNSSTYAQLPANVLPPPGSEMTLELIVKRKADISGYHQLIDRDPFSERLWQWRFESGSPDLNFIKIPSTVQTQLAAGVLAASGTAILAVTVDSSGVVRQYKNGVQVGTATITATNYGSSSNGIWIGRRMAGDNQGNYFCAESLIYPVALSASRILAHAQAAELST